VSGSTNDGTSSGSPPDERFDRPNINGSKVNTNADFLCEIVSIQLSNPFDRPISLSLPSNVPPLAENASDADRAAWQLQYGTITAGETPITDLTGLQYYIEFAGRYFAVADADYRNSGTGGLKSVVLEPGASRNFLILADTPANLLARFRKVQRAAVPPLTQAEFFNWLDRQFTSAGMADPVVLRQIDPQNMALGSAFALDNPSPTNVATVSPLTPEANFTPAPTNKQVKLWRAQRFGTEVTGSNLLGNDQLVDRLRDPSSTVNSLEIGFRPAVTAIDSTAGGLETDLTGNHDNKGLTAALWSVIRRPRWSSTTGEAIGNLPLWTMESKNLAPTNAENPTKAYNEADRFPSGSGTTVIATKSHFVSTFASFIGIAGSTGPSGAEPCLAAALPASAQIGNAIPGTDLNFSRLAIANLEQLQLRVAPGSPSPVQHPMPLRTADILMAWAIGPFDAPLRVNGDPETEQDTRYTTLSEAIALALDVDTPTEPTDAFYRLGARSKFAPSEPQYTTTSDGILDGGFLRLDVGVPYNDLDANGRFGQTGRVLPVNPGSTDAIPDPQRGLGVPFAFNILERFRTDRFGTIYSGYQGRVNINTAPRAVLSALPMVTPDGDSGAWVRGGGTSAVYQPSTETYDVAAALIAYRDKQLVYTRPIGGSTSRGTPIDMSDDNKDEVAINRQRADGQYFQIGRRNATGIDALRETPGFQTPGEVLAARIGQTFRDATKRITVTDGDDLVRSGIDRLGRDDRALPPRVGATSSVYVSGTNIDANDARDSYEQRLAIANAVLGTTTLRSDTFCVWFVVEGFRPSDVQGLQSFVPAPQQVAVLNDPLFTVPEYSTPMTPSFKRRYMMVLDRSNVTKQGDKPKILLLQEVPL